MRVAVLVLILSLASMLLPSPAGAAGVDAIPTILERIFAGRPEANFMTVVLRDPGRRQYMAFYISTYLDLKEVRVYVIPYRGADVANVDAALDSGDHETAFASLLSGMRLSMGARYVSDVNLDGIRDEAVALGSGTIRDGFHREQFASHEEADRAYREWLQMALELVTS